MSDAPVRHLAWVLPGAYAAIIFYLSHQTGVPDEVQIFSDKALHAVEYSVLGALVVRALTKTTHLTTMTRGLFALVLTALYGASDEFHQSFIPGRSAEVADWYADVVGGAIGVGIYFLTARRWRGTSSDTRG